MFPRVFDAAPFFIDKYSTNIRWYGWRFQLESGLTHLKKSSNCTFPSLSVSSVSSISCTSEEEARPEFSMESLRYFLVTIPSPPNTQKAS